MAVIINARRKRECAGFKLLKVCRKRGKETRAKVLRIRDYLRLKLIQFIKNYAARLALKRGARNKTEVGGQRLEISKNCLDSLLTSDL